MFQSQKLILFYPKLFQSLQTGLFTENKHLSTEKAQVIHNLEIKFVLIIFENVLSLINKMIKVFQQAFLLILLKI